MKISCPHCGQHYEVDDSTLGAEVTCEKCGNGFAASPMPDPEPVEKAVPAAPDATFPETGATAQAAPERAPDAADGKSAATPLTWDSFDPPADAPMSKEEKQELHNIRCMFMNVAAWALMVLATVSSIAKEAFGFPEIFFALAAIFTLLARPRDPYVK